MHNGEDGDGGGDVICHGVPMTIQQMQENLQQCHGRPIVLGEQGMTRCTCPHCQKAHESDPGSGHFNVACEDESRFNGVCVVVGDRRFMASHGVTAMECIRDGNDNESIQNTDWS